MRRGSLLVLTLLPLVAAASAQAPAQVPALPPPPALAQALARTGAPILKHAPAQFQGQLMFVASSPALRSRATPDDLVARIMTFDRDSDGRVTSDELNERMQPLLSRGDVNGDRALDRTELRTLANARTQTQTSVRGFPASAGGYGFGDDFGQDSRLHIEGAIEDLRLSADARSRALAAARSFVDAFEASSTATLLKEMGDVLTAEQLADFSRALETRDVSRNLVSVALIHAQSNGHDASRFRVVRTIEVTLETLLAKYELSEAQKHQALTSIRVWSGRRVGDAERSALVARLGGILSDEERDNFRAALERRPVVKAGARRFAVAHSAGGPVSVDDHKVLGEAIGGVVAVNR